MVFFISFNSKIYLSLGIKFEKFLINSSVRVLILVFLSCKHVKKDFVNSLKNNFGYVFLIWSLYFDSKFKSSNLNSKFSLFIKRLGIFVANISKF